jgi:hypothetical protein
MILTTIVTLTFLSTITWAGTAQSTNVGDNSIATVIDDGPITCIAVTSSTAYNGLVGGQMNCKLREGAKPQYPSDGKIATFGFGVAGREASLFRLHIAGQVCYMLEVSSAMSGGSSSIMSCL